ncbi:hypothetical protein SLEP1_g38754 [Rubroshorea leprosula]|uniref:J domain-containing protein required for chloroplast accumulation response 1 n=2 Tax=Rubroshorea leprosula TaxID=152421 RepID=A0AAV5KYQ6_9ROSI|nr:hypothetical protein SLEP1_g38754 [Rubroshorea leprosula]
MHRLSQRESVVYGYNNSPNTPQGNSDFDFNDVFGGPPRRFSIQELRHSESADSHASRRNDETVALGKLWSGLSEKPVFGEGGVNRSRNSSDNFFDDIFNGSQPLCSSPRKYERELFSSSPGFQVLSPARPLPPKAEPFGSSLPAQFSLPAKLNKGMELPTFGSATGSRNKDGGSNGLSSYLFSPLSRSSSQAEDSRNKLRNGSQSSRRLSALSRELSLGSEDSLELTKHDETETKSNSMKDLNDSELNGSQFHFSIYKWASKGIPLAMPLRGGNGSRSKEKDRPERCSSQIACESMANGLPTAAAAAHDAALVSNDRISATTEPTGMDKSTDNREPCQTNKEAIPPTSESQTSSPLGSAVDNANDDIAFCKKGEETTPCSIPESNKSKIVKENSAVKEEAHKPKTPEPKSLGLPFYGDDQQGIVNKTERAGRKQSANNIKKPSVILDAVENLKKIDRRRYSFDSAEVGKTSMQGSPRNSGNLGKSKVRGKVKEFVRMFNQDSSSKPTIDNASKNQSSRWKETGTVKADNKVNIGMSERVKKMQMPSVRKETSSPDVSVMVDDYLEKTAKRDSTRNDPKHIWNGAPVHEDSTATKAVPNGSKADFGDPDESFEENVLIKEIIQDEIKVQQSSIDPEGMQVIESKIRQWSNGKLGNIRSLLSTLQYVLWPDSGWKPVPLMDIIEGNAVKRSYQRALLCLHPDKLQQKGANLQQKYTAEKVFDILQDAWTHFSSLGSV